MTIKAIFTYQDARKQKLAADAKREEKLEPKIARSKQAQLDAMYGPVSGYATWYDSSFMPSIPSRWLPYYLWWDPSIKLWTVVFVDENRNQVGGAEYFPKKKIALERLRK